MNTCTLCLEEQNMIPMGACLYVSEFRGQVKNQLQFLNQGIYMWRA